MDDPLRKDRTETMTEIILANARLILRDGMIDGSVLIRNGRIADLAEGRGVPKGAEDLGGDLLAPGLIELFRSLQSPSVGARSDASSQNWPIGGVTPKLSLSRSVK